MLSSRTWQASRLLRGLQVPPLAADGALAAGGGAELLPALLRLVGLTRQYCQAAAATAAEPAPGQGGASGVSGRSGSSAPPAAQLHCPQQRQWSSSSSTSSTSGSSSSTAEQLEAHEAALAGSESSSGTSSTNQQQQQHLAKPGGVLRAPLESAVAGVRASIAADAADEEAGDWKMQTAAEMLSMGGTLAVEVAATIDYLQTRAGISRKQAEHAVQRIRNYGPPQAQCFRMRTPRLLSFELEVKPVVELLMAIPGCDMRVCLPRHPHILVDSPVARMRQNIERLTQRLQLAPAELGRIVTYFPFVLRLDLDKRVFPLLDYFGELGLDVDKQRALLLKYPAVVSYSLERIQGRVQWLRDEGLTPDNLRTVLLKYTQIVCMSAQNSEKWRAWLLEQGIPCAALAHIIVRLPMVLTYGPEKREAFLQFVRGDLQLDDATIARILHHVPDTMGRATASLRRNVAVMQQQWGFSPEQIRRLVMGNPGVLRLDFSSCTYEAKLRFMNDMLQVDDLRETLIRHPFYISYRLDRIASRACYLKSLGQAFTSITAWLACSETNFCQKYTKTSMLEYQAWREGWRQSKEGRYWLGAAALRQSKMHKKRLDQEIALDAVALAAHQEEAQQEAAVAAKEARLAAAHRMLQAQADEAEAAAEGTAAAMAAGAAASH